MLTEILSYISAHVLVFVNSTFTLTLVFVNSTCTFLNLSVLTNFSMSYPVVIVLRTRPSAIGCRLDDLLPACGDPNAALHASTAWSPIGPRAQFAIVRALDGAVLLHEI